MNRTKDNKKDKRESRPEKNTTIQKIKLNGAKFSEQLYPEYMH